MKSLKLTDSQIIKSVIPHTLKYNIACTSDAVNLLIVTAEKVALINMYVEPRGKLIMKKVAFWDLVRWR